jgi:hypothetical protein
MSYKENNTLISARREFVLQSYKSAEAENYIRFLEGDDTATEKYIYPNQIEDANNIVDKFYKNKRHVISIQKKTKVGADGLMIEISKLLTTHNDDNFVVNPMSVRIITGMSNAGWEKDMIEKAPTCFKDKIFHHGKLSKSDLIKMKNGLIIIDEIDTGDKENQVLHKILKDAGVLDVNHMKINNNRFVFISATMIKELYDLYRWGDLHELYIMTIPQSYIGHIDLLNMGIIKEFYCLHTIENACKWIKEDIIDNYNTDYRVHIVRVYGKTADVIKIACTISKIQFRNHTSSEKLTNDEIKEFFKEPLSNHIILAIKGFFRRANLIPNKWKLRIGATHELYTKVIDNNTLIQALPGRMTGYWRYDLENGHKTGPHRTSIQSIIEYEKIYLDPFGLNSYQTSSFKKKKGKVSSTTISTMLSPHNVKNLTPIDLPIFHTSSSVPIVITLSQEEFNSITKIRGTWDYVTILKLINKYSPSTHNKIKHMVKGQIVKPETDTSYGKLITAFVNASLNNTKYTWTLSDDDYKGKDVYQIYLDNRLYRIIISIYYGNVFI